MKSVLTRHLTTFLFWSFIPSILSGYLLKACYSIFPHFRPTVPVNAPQEQVAYENERARKHARNSRVILIGGYLIWTIIIEYVSQGQRGQPNFYTLLGIRRSVVEIEGPVAVKGHWRKLARLYHPDKVGVQGEPFFVALRRGVECLENDTKRWAYERFGPDILDWGKLTTNREYLLRGAQQIIGFYLFAFASIVLLSIFRKEERANGFWRYLSLLSILSVECLVIMRSHPSPILSFLMPNRLQFEHVALLRQVFISVSLAMSQLAPLYTSDSNLGGNPHKQQAVNQSLADSNILKPLLQRLAQLTAQVDAEAFGMYKLELKPLLLAPSPEAGVSKKTTDEATAESEQSDQEKEVVEKLKRQIMSTYIDIQLKSNPETAQIWNDAVHQSRMNGKSTHDTPLDTIPISTPSGPSESKTNSVSPPASTVSKAALSKSNASIPEVATLPSPRATPEPEFERSFSNPISDIARDVKINAAAEQGQDAKSVKPELSSSVETILTSGRLPSPPPESEK